MSQPQPAKGQRAKGRFSLEQIRQMMLVEFERAQRQRYPLVCMVMGVDDFPDLIEVYGEERKAEIMQAGFGLLKRVTQANNLQGLGCWTKERLLAIFPHTGKQLASEIAEQIVKGARELEFERDGHSHAVTLSVGVSRNMHDDTKTLETLIRAAERGLAMATEAGGDRFVHWVEVESELEKIRSELEEQTRLLRASSADAFQTAEAEQTEYEKALLLRLREIFASVDRQSPNFEELEQQITRLFKNGLSDNRRKALEETMAKHSMQMAMLERRINKLNKSLGMTEAELKRVASMKMIDTGIASIYSEVQGISAEDAQAELKRELMADIFKANLTLKHELQERKASAA